MDARVVGIAASLLMLAAGCGGGSSTKVTGIGLTATVVDVSPSAAPIAYPPLLVQAQKDQTAAFRTAVAPSINALTILDAALAGGAPDTKIAVLAAPVAQALDRVDAALTRGTYAGQPPFDMRNVTDFARLLAGDLRCVSAHEPLTYARCRAELRRDITDLRGAEEAVRVALAVSTQR